MRTRAALMVFDHDARLGDPLLCDGLVGDACAKGDTARRAPAHPLECALGEPNQPHAMVDAAGPEPALGNLNVSGVSRSQRLLTCLTSMVVPAPR